MKNQFSDHSLYPSPQPGRMRKDGRNSSNSFLYQIFEKSSNLFLCQWAVDTISNRKGGGWGCCGDSIRVLWALPGHNSAGLCWERLWGCTWAQPGGYQCLLRGEEAQECVYAMPLSVWVENLLVAGLQEKRKNPEVFNVLFFFTFMNGRLKLGLPSWSSPSLSQPMWSASPTEACR